MCSVGLSPAGTCDLGSTGKFLLLQPGCSQLLREGHKSSSIYHLLTLRRWRAISEGRKNYGCAYSPANLQFLKPPLNAAVAPVFVSALLVGLGRESLTPLSTIKQALNESYCKLQKRSEAVGSSTACHKSPSKIYSSSPPSGDFAVGVRNPLQGIAFLPLRTQLYLLSLFINALGIAIVSLGERMGSG